MGIKKATWIGVSALVAGAVVAPRAHAMTNLKQVRVSGGSEVNLVFDTRVKSSQVRTEFFNDVIQISLTNASVYPAKITAVSGASLTKVFAYQYAPRLVRCRLTVRGRAEDFKNRVAVRPNGRVLTVTLDGVDGSPDGSGGSTSSDGGGGGGDSASDRLVLRAAHPTAASAHVSGAGSAAAPSVGDADEQALLDRVMKDEKLPVYPLHPKKSAEGREQQSAMPSPVRALGSLAIVTALFLALAFVVKKFRKPKGHAAQAGSRSDLMGRIGSFARGKLGGKGVIEIVTTQALGPKKSIAVVKVAGRMLVLGIAADSINLIAQLDADAAIPDLGSEDHLTDSLGSGATVAGPAVFSRMLESEGLKPAGPAGDSARSKIRSRLEGLKPL